MAYSASQRSQFRTEAQLELSIPRPHYERLQGPETQLADNAYRTPVIAMAMQTARERSAARPSEEAEFWALYQPNHTGNLEHPELADFTIC